MASLTDLELFDFRLELCANSDDPRRRIFFIGFGYQCPQPVVRDPIVESKHTEHVVCDLRSELQATYNTLRPNCALCCSSSAVDRLHRNAISAVVSAPWLDLEGIVVWSADQWKAVPHRCSPQCDDISLSCMAALGLTNEPMQ